MYVGLVLIDNTTVWDLLELANMYNIELLRDVSNYLVPQYDQCQHNSHIKAMYPISKGKYNIRKRDIYLFLCRFALNG